MKPDGHGETVRRTMTSKLQLDRRVRWFRRLIWDLSDDKVFFWLSWAVGSICAVLFAATVAAQIWIRWHR